MTASHELIEEAAEFFRGYELADDHTVPAEYLAIPVIYAVIKTNTPGPLRPYVQDSSEGSMAMGFLTREGADYMKPLMFPHHPVHEGTLGDMIQNMPLGMHGILVMDCAEGSVGMVRLVLSRNDVALAKMNLELEQGDSLDEIIEVPFPDNTEAGSFSDVVISVDTQMKIHEIMKDEGLEQGYVVQMCDPRHGPRPGEPAEPFLAIRVHFHLLEANGDPIGTMERVHEKLLEVDPTIHFVPEYGRQQEPPERDW